MNETNKLTAIRVGVAALGLTLIYGIVSLSNSGLSQPHAADGIVAAAHESAIARLAAKSLSAAKSFAIRHGDAVMVYGGADVV